MILRHFLPQIIRVSFVVFPLLLLYGYLLKAKEVLTSRSRVPTHRGRFGTSS
jgi:hypothetical protein